MGRLNPKSEQVSHLPLPRVENWKHLPSRNKSQVGDLKGDTGFERGREKQQELMGYREDPRWGEMVAAEGSVTPDVTLRVGSCLGNGEPHERKNQSLVLCVGSMCA